MNEHQYTEVEQLSSTLPTTPRLKEGYTNVNMADNISYYKSNKPLNEYLKEQITTDLSNEEGAWECFEELEEIRPTDYIQNPRPVHTFVFKNSVNETKKIFSFDVTSCLY
jgi:hypothetical protein